MKGLDNVSVAGLFVGCGGLDYGFHKAGFDLCWANDFEKDAAISYKTLTGHSAIVDDIWNKIEDVPPAEILIGGPPCQSFSLVGKRKENDPRGRLVFAFKDIIKRIKPQAFVLENVAGLTASRINGKRLHLHLAEKFKKYGYNVSVHKIMATDFFVPQRRKRIFIVGHRFANKKFELISSREYSQFLGLPQLTVPISVSDALDDLPAPLEKGNTAGVTYIKKPSSPYAKIMREEGLSEVRLHSLPTMSELDREFVRHIPPGGNYMNIPDAVSTKRIMSFKATGGRTTTYGRLHPERPAYTINTYFNRPNVGANYHHSAERLITVREALRLQSFPDHFTPTYSNQRSLHMQIGNAVPPLLARAVAESVGRLFQ